jgi:hypothetical protein
MNALSIRMVVIKDVRTLLVHSCVPVVMDMFSLVMEGHALVSHPCFLTDMRITLYGIVLNAERIMLS